MGSQAKPFSPFDNVRQWYGFRIEWNRETGRLLMTDERRREEGLARIAEADRLEEERKKIGERKR